MSVILLTSASFSHSLDYSTLFLWRKITSLLLLQSTSECSRHFFFHKALPTLNIQFKNVHCYYINLIDSKYIISPLKAFVHCVATIHKSTIWKYNYCSDSWELIEHNWTIFYPVWDELEWVQTRLLIIRKLEKNRLNFFWFRAVRRFLGLLMSNLLLVWNDLAFCDYF